MGSEWRVVKYTLGDLVELSQGLAINAKTKHLLVDKGLPLLRITDLINNSEVQFVNEIEVPVKCIARRADIIYTRTGQVGLVFKGKVGVVHNNCFKVIPNERLLDAEYLFWFLSQKSIQLYANGIAAGSVQKDLNHSAFKSISIDLPPLWHQKRVGPVLLSIDNKIELNRQTNQTLEQMAQALFKSWFVDFDPVIDNALAAGNPIPEELQARVQRRQQQLAKPDHQPLPDDVRQLFPSEFEETEELGWVPKGWEAGTLGSIASVLSGFAFKSKDFVEKGEAVIKIKNINSDRTVDITDVNRVSAQVASSAERFLLTDGDIVMAMTGATVGKFGIIVTEENEAYFLNQRVCKFSSKAEGGSVFLYSALNKPGVEEGIVDSAQGSAQPNISASAILSTPMVIPSKELIALFSRQMESSYIRRITLKKEGYKLAKLRDTLLPKLISGELRLPESMLDSETEPSVAETAYE